MAIEDEKEIIDGLTDEERAAIEEGGDEDATPSEDEIEATADAGASADPSADAASASDNDQILASAADEILPPLRAKAPENADEILTQLTAQEEELATKFDDGDLTAREYRQALREIDAKRSEIETEKLKADLATQMFETAKDNVWRRDVAEFMTTTAAHIAQSQVAMEAYDKFVRDVTSNPENQRLSNKQQLEKAYKLFMDDVGKALGVQPTKAKADSEPAPRAARQQQRVIPPTLARIPAAEGEMIDGGKFAALDRLASTDPVAYEAAVARLSPAELAQYSTGA